MQQLQENFEILLSQCRHLLLSSVVERKFTDLLLLKKSLVATFNIHFFFPIFFLA